MEHEDAKGGLLPFAALLARDGVNVLLQLLDRVLERGARVVDLVDDQDVPADEVRHGQRAQVQPLRARDGLAGLLDAVRLAQVLVEREPDSLDWDVGGAGLLEERPIEPEQPRPAGKRPLGLRTARCAPGHSPRRQWHWEMVNIMLRKQYMGGRMYIIKLGLKSLRIVGADAWHSLWTCDEDQTSPLQAGLKNTGRLKINRHRDMKCNRFGAIRNARRPWNAPALLNQAWRALEQEIQNSKQRAAETLAYLVVRHVDLLNHDAGTCTVQDLGVWRARCVRCSYESSMFVDFKGSSGDCVRDFIKRTMDTDGLAVQARTPVGGVRRSTQGHWHTQQAKSFLSLQF